MKKILLYIIWFVGRYWSYIYSYSLNKNINRIKSKLYSAWISKELKTFSKDSKIEQEIYLIGGKYISIGNKTCIGSGTALCAWDKYEQDTFHPEIVIGNNVSIGNDCHITAINRIEIGNNVLMGKKITITDNSHGKSEPELLLSPPVIRPLYSAGPVIIKEGVWIGDKATILPNVRIGENAIVGANAVVTRDIPANCVVGGIPAKVIKIIM